jgi:hypothetical protein
MNQSILIARIVYRAVKVLMHQLQRQQTHTYGHRAKDTQGARLQLLGFAHHGLPDFRHSEKHQAFDNHYKAKSGV